MCVSLQCPSVLCICCPSGIPLTPRLLSFSPSPLDVTGRPFILWDGLGASHGPVARSCLEVRWRIRKEAAGLPLGLKEPDGKRLGSSWTGLAVRIGTPPALPGIDCQPQEQIPALASRSSPEPATAGREQAHPSRGGFSASHGAARGAASPCLRSAFTEGNRM